MEKLPRSCNLCVVTYGSDRGRGKFSHLALVFSFFFFSLFVYSFATKRMSIVKTIFPSFDIFFILRFLFHSSFFFVSIIIREQRRVIITFLC